MAGMVEEVGSGVSTFHPGDEVYGMVGGVGGLQGTLAEYVVADADLLALKPKSLSMREAAALRCITITASEGLVDRAKVHSGQKVLIHAGAGGVGHVAVQIAKASGRRGLRHRSRRISERSRKASVPSRSTIALSRPNNRRPSHERRGLRRHLRHRRRCHHRRILRRGEALHRARRKLSRLEHALACTALISQRNLLRRLHSLSAAQRHRPRTPRRDSRARQSHWPTPES